MSTKKPAVKRIRPSRAKPKAPHPEHPGSYEDMLTASCGVMVNQIMIGSVRTGVAQIVQYAQLWARNMNEYLKWEAAQQSKRKRK